MKKLLILLLILTFSRATVTFGNPNDGLSIRDYFLGNSALANTDVNQVLALLVGPAGPPGPAGVAGRNGFNGINGLDGRDGIPGAPGPVGPQGPQGPQGERGLPGLQGVSGATGPQGPVGVAGADGAPGPAGPAGPAGAAGASVIVQSISVGDMAQCGGRGGTKFISGSTISFACNGATGSGVGGSSSLGQGTIVLQSCDDQVNFEIKTRFTGADFVFDSVRITGVASDCLGSILELYFKIKDSGALNLPGAVYNLNELLTCSLPLSSANNLGSLENNIFEYAANRPCSLPPRNPPGSAPTEVTLGEIGTRDINALIGFQIRLP